MIFLLLAISRDKFLNLAELVKWKVYFKFRRSPKCSMLEKAGGNSYRGDDVSFGNLSFFFFLGIFLLHINFKIYLQ